MIRTRFAIVAFIVLVSIHYFLNLSNNTYSQVTSETFSVLAEKWRYVVTLNETQYQFYDEQGEMLEVTSTMPAPIPMMTPEPMEPQRANATLVMLARNSELWDVISSVKAMEDRFNRNYNYPWVFLNDEPFTEEFMSRVSVLSNANVSFGLIPSDHWNQPDSIDETLASQNRQTMVSHGVIYGASVSYRNMCRFNSGFFFRHELLQPYRYYWRVEPNIKYFCDLDYDPFLFMDENNKTYGFTISLEEFPETVKTLWDQVKLFKRDYPHFIAENNAEEFLSKDGGETYNMCHFWSNFEIADMDFWRSKAYMTFFNMLEEAGGFYYERWGDAPVHSIAAALMLPKEKLHFFHDVGYRHEPFQHCPQGDAHVRGKCSCDPQDNFDYTGWASCMPKWDNLWR